MSLLRIYAPLGDAPLRCEWVLIEARQSVQGEAGLADLPRGADHVQVAFGAVSFADWLGWIAALQTQHVRLEAARIEALSAPGVVSASATLTRAGAQ